VGASLLITFRESLEATLVIGIVLAFLGRAGFSRLRAAVWAGAALGVAASLAAAYLFMRIFGEFEGKAEQTLEGSVMLVGSLLMATLILWLNKGDVRASIEAKSAASARKGSVWSIGFLVFVSVLREGIETVIFIGSSLRTDGLAGGLGALAGLALAAALGLAFFRSGMRVGVRGFFAATNALLVLFAAGLFGRCVGEFNEAGILPPLVDRLYDTGRLVAEEGPVGAFLRGLFGYTAAPTLAQVIAYAAFLAAIGIVAWRGSRPTSARST
jgi:high-affinity iron transporter